jgi:zinc transport system ATP-binding protein
MDITHGGYTQEGKSILDDVNLSIYPKEFITLVGPNGAGKTTLLKILLKLISPTHGHVFHKKNISIGYVPQRIAINPLLPLSVGQFLKDIACGASLDPYFLNLLRIEKFLDHSVHYLSGGEMQRVLLMQAMSRNPDVLILDEPDQGLDISGQAHLYEILECVQKKTQCAIFLVSHFLHLVFAKSHRVICLNHHICCHGKPEDVQSHKDFQKLFPQYKGVLAPYHHVHDHDHV